MNGMLSLTLAYVAVAALWDLRTGHIPNRLTLPALALGSLLQLFALGGSASSFDISLLALAAARVALGIVLCGLVPYLLFLRNGIGGGDVKLLASVGAFLGPAVGLEVQLYAFVVMAVLAPARLAYQGRLFPVLHNAFSLLVNPLRPKRQRESIAPELLTSVKFGPAVLAAMAAVTLLRWEHVG